MLYTSLPPSEGAIANTVKERIIAWMHDKGEGYLSAARACGIGSQRAHAELRADKAFAEHVGQAREAIAERLAEELIALADTADEDNASAVALKVKTRQWTLEKVLPRFRPITPHTQVNVDNRTVNVVLTEEKRAELQNRLKRLQAESITSDNSSKVKSKAIS